MSRLLLKYDRAFKVPKWDNEMYNSFYSVLLGQAIKYGHVWLEENHQKMKSEYCSMWDLIILDLSGVVLEEIFFELFQLRWRPRNLFCPW